MDQAPKGRQNTSMGHTNTQLVIHAVFSTKHREPVQNDDLRQRLFAYIGSIVRDEGASAIIVNGPADHVHLLIQYPAKLCVADLMRVVKAGSSKWMKEQGEAWFTWQFGYSAFSGHDRIDRVREYIERQEEHHKKKAFQDELRWFLRVHGIELQEDYLWD